VESYRTERGPRQRVVAYLGRLDEQGRLGVKEAAAAKTKNDDPQRHLPFADASSVRRLLRWAVGDHSLVVHVCKPTHHAFPEEIIERVMSEAKEPVGRKLQQATLSAKCSSKLSITALVDTVASTAERNTSVGGNGSIGPDVARDWILLATELVRR